MKYLKLFESRYNYTRVIPRDFFNDSKLLKCMGFLALHILNNTVPNNIHIKIESEEKGEPFDIRMCDDTFLCVSNYETFVNDENVLMKSKYNSKDNFNLYCEFEDEDYLVFDENGHFTKEFIDRFTNE